MATINAVGFETHGVVNSFEVFSQSGTPTINTANARTGAACLAISAASGAAELVRIGGYDANGRLGAFARTAETFYTFYFRFTSIPTLNCDFAAAVTSGGGNVVVLNITSAGAVRLVGATTSATIATVSTGVWYRFDLRVTSNGTAGGAIDGGTEQTCAAQNQTQGLLQFGRSGTTATALDVLFDDAYISDSAFPPAGDFHVRPLYPVGAGATADWTNGTGSTFAEVDDWATGAHDTDTSYISASATQDNLSSDFDMTSCATAGVSGTIVSVVGIAAMRTDSTSGASIAGMLMRAADGTEYLVATPLELTTSYVVRSVGPHDTDPETATAWTTSGLDGTTFGVKAGTLAQVQRCTALLVYVAHVASSGTTETLDAAGTLTSAGALVAKVGKALAGTLTTAGAIASSSVKIVRSGTLTTAGTLTSIVKHSLAATLTTTGLVALRATQTFAGTLTSSGSLAVRRIQGLAVSGTLTTAGALAPTTVRKALSATLTSSGALTARITQSFAGTLTTAGDLAVRRLKTLAADGLLASAGSVAWRASTQLTATLTTAGTLTKRATQSLSGTLTTAGALTVSRAQSVSMSGTLTSAGALLHKVSATTAGTLTSGGAVAWRASRSIAGTLTTAGALTLSRVSPLATSSTLSTAGLVSWRAAKTLSGTLTMSGELTTTGGASSGEERPLMMRAHFKTSLSGSASHEPDSTLAAEHDTSLDLGGRY